MQISDMARPTKHQKRYENVGRPTVVTPEVLQKLEESFINAFTDEMACLYAGIGHTALYDYCQDNLKFAERKEILKKSPDLKAQQTLVKDVNNTNGARWWAEHKMPDFMPKTKVEHSGRIDAGDGTTNDATEAVRIEYEKKLRATIAAGRKKV